MQCYLCNADLIWGGDHDVEDSEDYYIETNLTCSECSAFHLVLWPIQPEGEDDEHHND